MSQVLFVLGSALEVGFCVSLPPEEEEVRGCLRSSDGAAERRIWLNGAAAACPGEGEQRMSPDGAAAPSFLGDGAAERRICLNGATAACDGGGKQRL
jgi:hypothetical protein